MLKRCVLSVTRPVRAKIIQSKKTPMWLSVCLKVINKWVEMKNFNILRIISIRLKTWWWLDVVN